MQIHIVGQNPKNSRGYPTPTAIRGFNTRQQGKNKTLDLVLSFLDEEYPDKETTFAKVAVESIEKKQRKHKLFLTRMLDVEKFRRADYWSRKSKILNSELFGWYFLIRKTTRDKVELEALYLAQNSKLEQVVDGYWYRHTDRGPKACVGNFYCADSSLLGTFFRASSDKLFHPIHMTIGYRGNTSDKIQITTGFLTGSKIEDASIFHYPFAIYGYEHDTRPIESITAFMQTAEERLRYEASSDRAKRHEQTLVPVVPKITDRDFLKI